MTLISNSTVILPAIYDDKVSGTSILYPDCTGPGKWHLNVAVELSEKPAYCTDHSFAVYWDMDHFKPADLAAVISTYIFCSTWFGPHGASP